MRQLCYALFFGATAWACSQFVSSSTAAPIDSAQETESLEALVAPLLQTEAIGRVAAGVIQQERSVIIELPEKQPNQPNTYKVSGSMMQPLFRLALVLERMGSDQTSPADPPGRPTDPWLRRLALREEVEATEPAQLTTMILQPLGMTSTNADENGTWRTTPRDWMKWLQAQLEVPDGAIGVGIKSLQRKQIPSTQTGSFARTAGWQVAQDGNSLFVRGGGNDSVSMFAHPQLKLGSFVMTDQPHEMVSGVAEQLVQRAAGLSVNPIRTPKSITVSNEVMDRYVGRYELAPTFVFDVKRVDNQLMVGVTNQPTHQVYPKSEQRWFYKVVDAALDFRDIRDGKAHRLILDQNGIRQEAIRIE